MRKLLPKAFFYAFVIMFTLFVAYSSIFTTQVRCLFAPQMGFEAISTNIYVHPDLSEAQRQALIESVSIAKNRLRDFFGDISGRPIILAGNSEEAMSKFGIPMGTPGMNHTTLFGSYIVLTEEGMNVDVISHELCHAELFARVGWYNRQVKIPTWFDEGLALMLDYRYANSEAMWLMITHHGTKAPSLEELSNMQDFMFYTQQSPYLSYVTAMREVETWWELAGRDGFLRFTELIRSGVPFHQAYQEAMKE